MPHSDRKYIFLTFNAVVREPSTLTASFSSLSICTQQMAHQTHFIVSRCEWKGAATHKTERRKHMLYGGTDVRVFERGALVPGVLCSHEVPQKKKMGSGTVGEFGVGTKVHGSVFLVIHSWEREFIFKFHWRQCGYFSHSKTKQIRKINTLRDALAALEVSVEKQSACWLLPPPVACTWFYTHLLRLGLSKTGALWVEQMSKVIFLWIPDSQAAFITVRDKLQGPVFNLPATPHKLFNIIIPGNCAVGNTFKHHSLVLFASQLVLIKFPMRKKLKNFGDWNERLSSMNLFVDQLVS